LLIAPALLVLGLVGPAPAQELASVREHTARIGSLSFSPDGKRLASSQAWPTRNAKNAYKTLVWDVATRKVLYRLDHRRQALFAGDEILFLAGVNSYGKEPSLPATLVDPSGKLLHTFPERTSHMFFGSLDGFGGKSLVIGYSYTSLVGPDEKHGGTGFEVYDLTTRKLTYRRVYEGGVIQAAAVSRDGRDVALAFYNPGLLAGLSDDNPECAAVVYRLTAGRKPLSIFTGHKEYVGSVAFAPDGKSVATSGRERAVPISTDNRPNESVQVWDAATGKERFRIDFASGASDHIPVAFSPDGEVLAVSWCEGKVWTSVADNRPLDDRPENIGVLKVFDAATGKELADLRGTSTLAGKRVTDRHGQPVELRGKSHPAAQLAFSPDRKILASGHDDGTIKLWDVAKALQRPGRK
jgi:WD40 repeat protein